MDEFNRRKFLEGSASVAAAASLGTSAAVFAPAVQAIISQLPSADPADSVRFFRYRSLDVLVSYDTGTRHCNDLLLLGRNEAQLMQRAGLSDEAANYLLLPVFYAHQPTQMLGLRVVPLGPRQSQ